MRIVVMLCTTNAIRPTRFRPDSNTSDAVKANTLHVFAMELWRAATVMAAIAMAASMG
jgi:hypothetical protein